MDSGLLVPANSVIIQAVMEVMAVKGEKSFAREQRQGKVFIRMTLASVQPGVGLIVPARCFTGQMWSVSCQSFVSDGRERRINIFDCSLFLSNREFPDPSHRTKITTASLKKVLLSRRRCGQPSPSAHAQGREMLTRGEQLGERERHLKSISYIDSEVSRGETIILLHSSPN